MLNTLYYQVDPLSPAVEPIAICGGLIREGGLVGFPTETVYGLGANALDGQACGRIFFAKGRPQDNPLIVHVAAPEDIVKLTSALPPLAIACMEHFWPGPLTLVVPKSEQVPSEVTAGLDTVAIRMPDHPVALELIRAAGVPIAAPSANLSGRPSPTLAKHVLNDLGGKIEAVLDGGACRVGVESTVLDVTGARPLILRPGGITREQLEEKLGMQVDIDPGLSDQSIAPRSPGVKYTHYSPKGQVILLEGPAVNVCSRIKHEVQQGKQNGLRVGILCTLESAPLLSNTQADFLAILGPRNHPWEVAPKLYAALRECDDKGIDLILTESISPSGMGAAVMNRLQKAAGYHTITVN
ncbi:MAG TPA: L-threonylcarbamoyladenylate synthase [Candidatus Deferrimicrobium sp.]|nr:L-threonylcarbamoyladenylate synthase [Candidatus Deferrimicrobium sp.]